MNDHVTYRGLLYQFVHVAQIVKIPGVVQLMIMSDKKNILISYPSSVPNRHIQILHKHTAMESTVYNEKKKPTHKHIHKTKTFGLFDNTIFKLESGNKPIFFLLYFWPRFLCLYEKTRISQIFTSLHPYNGSTFPWGTISVFQCVQFSRKLSCKLHFCDQLFVKRQNASLSLSTSSGIHLTTRE